MCGLQPSTFKSARRAVSATARGVTPKESEARRRHPGKYGAKSESSDSSWRDAFETLNDFHEIGGIPIRFNFGMANSPDPAHAESCQVASSCRVPDL